MSTSQAGLPAALGGPPVFGTMLDVVRPVFPREERVRARLVEVLASGKVTNHGRYVRALEERLAEVLGVRNVVAVANATLGLIAAVQALERHGTVLLPSFTYPATAHAVRYAGLDLRFVDIDPRTLCLSPKAVEAALDDRVVALLPVVVFGNPCDVDGLEALARSRGLKTVYDSAQGFLSRYRGRPLGGFGDLEVLSFHATKVFPAGEGGAITTNDDRLAERCRAIRNFGWMGEECVAQGLNAKMTELVAILAIEKLGDVEGDIQARAARVAQFRRLVEGLPGLTFQTVTPHGDTNHQNLAILLDAELFGCSRDALSAALLEERVVTRQYFKSLHGIPIFAEAAAGADLPNTEHVAARVLVLPLYSDMREEEVRGLGQALEKCYLHHQRVERWYKERQERSQPWR